MSELSKSGLSGKINIYNPINNRQVRKHLFKRQPLLLLLLLPQIQFEEVNNSSFLHLMHHMTMHWEPLKLGERDETWNMMADYEFIECIETSDDYARCGNTKSNVMPWRIGVDGQQRWPGGDLQYHRHRICDGLSVESVHHLNFAYFFGDFYDIFAFSPLVLWEAQFIGFYLSFYHRAIARSMPLVCTHCQSPPSKAAEIHIARVSLMALIHAKIQMHLK